MPDNRPAMGPHRRVIRSANQRSFILPMRRLKQEQTTDEEWKEASKFRAAFKKTPQSSPGSIRHAGGT